MSAQKKKVKSPRKLFYKVRELFKRRKPLEEKTTSSRIIHTEPPIISRREAFKGGVIYNIGKKARLLTGALIFSIGMSMFSPVAQDVLKFFNPKYKVQNVLHAEEKNQVVKIPPEMAKKAFEVGKQVEMTYKTLEDYFKGYVGEYLEKRLKWSILSRGNKNTFRLIGGYESKRPLPLLENYKDKKVIKELEKELEKNKVQSYNNREGISWFPSSYIFYLNLNDRKDILRRLFNEYKRFIESNIQGVEVVPENSYVTAVFKVDENLNQREKFKIAERIAELTTDFVYKHVTQDEELSYVKEIFEDFIKNSNTLDGFRYYKYEVTAPWGDNYTVKAYLTGYGDEVDLEVYIFKGDEMIAFDLTTYYIREMTNGKIVGLAFVDHFPVVAGFIDEYVKRGNTEIYKIGILISHEKFSNTGVAYVIGLFKNGKHAKGEVNYIAAL